MAWNLKLCLDGGADGTYFRKSEARRKNDPVRPDVCGSGGSCGVVYPGVKSEMQPRGGIKLAQRREQTEVAGLNGVYAEPQRTPGGVDGGWKLGVRKRPVERKIYLYAANAAAAHGRGEGFLVRKAAEIKVNGGCTVLHGGSNGLRRKGGNNDLGHYGGSFLMK